MQVRICGLRGCGVSLEGRPPKTRFCTRAHFLVDYKTRPCLDCGGSRNGAHYSYCRECEHARHMWSRYKVTPEVVAAKLAEQGGRCAICPAQLSATLESLKRRETRIDHDHVTGVFRGVLCHRCNLGVGYFRDDPALLRAAVEYLTA